MNLIDKMIENRIERRLKKRSRLIARLKDQQTEYTAMSETLKEHSIHMEFINKYFGEKIDNIESKIKRIEKNILSDIKIYEERNPGKHVVKEVSSHDENNKTNL